MVLGNHKQIFYRFVVLGNVNNPVLQIEGINLMLLSAGPYFKFNPSVSFMVLCSNKDEVMKYWEAFIEGGQALMPIDNYGFSES